MSHDPALPAAATHSAFDAVVRDASALRPGVLGLCHALGQDTDRLVRFPTGSLPVHVAGQRAGEAEQDDRGHWSLSGLCDVEPAMRGSREYDFVAIGVFLAEGDPLLLREALTGYGYDVHQLDHDLARRLLAWTLLHRYGNVASYLPRLPSPSRPPWTTWPRAGSAPTDVFVTARGGPRAELRTTAAGSYWPT